MFNFNKLRGLKLLEHWIRISMVGIDSSKVMTPFFVLDDLRQIMDHLIVGKKKKEMLTYCNIRLGLVKRGNSCKTKYESLVTSISDSYHKLSNPCV